jgi:hypothetical protein
MTEIVDLIGDDRTPSRFSYVFSMFLDYVLFFTLFKPYQLCISINEKFIKKCIGLSGASQTQTVFRGMATVSTSTIRLKWTGAVTFRDHAPLPLPGGGDAAVRSANQSPGGNA